MNKKRNKKYIVVDDQGNILKDLLTTIDYSDKPEYIELPKHNISLLSKGTHKLRWDFDSKTLIEKTQIKLTVGTTRFPADGVSSVAICVRGDNIEPDDPVDILINNQRFTITKKDHIELVSDEAGVYEVSLSDSKYTASPSRYTIYATQDQDDGES